ncbi:MAG: Cytochrome c oxidase subunit 6B [Bathelium mastoideum]|nr:MAG: Cytochrome c oxidase subunit 6B [Bathelium mastoideum]
MSDSEEQDETPVTKPFKFVTAGSLFRLISPMAEAIAPALLYTCFDARFPNQNQTKHCWQNYVDYHKCIIAKGEEFRPCRQFLLAYRSLCPSAWVERWDDQRGT